MEYKYSNRKRMKDKPLMSKRNSVGAELHHLDQEKLITTDPGENNKRRTLRLHKRNKSWGFTLQTYGIKHKKTNEIEIMTYVDYVEINGAAWIAGMRRGDVILSVNGEKVGEVSHQQLVNKIRQTGEVMRLVVLFEDCCRKVDLHEKYIKLKGVLKSKYQELKEIEQEEMQILERYYESKGLNRFEQIRQSVLSNNSSSNDSWDAYSTISSPNGLFSTGHYAHGQWASVTSLKSFSVGDSSSTYDDDYSYMDSEVDCDDISNLGSDVTNLHKSDSNLFYNGADSLAFKRDNATKLRASRASDSVLYKQSKSSLHVNRNYKSKMISPGGSIECIDDVFEEKVQVETHLASIARVENDYLSENTVQDLTLQKDKVFYAGENGNIIVPKICIEGENIYTTFDAIDTNNTTSENDTSKTDKANYQDKIVAMEIAKEMARLDKIELENKAKEAGLPTVVVYTPSNETVDRNQSDTWKPVSGYNNLTNSSNGAINKTDNYFLKENNGARSKYSNSDFQGPWKQHLSTNIQSSVNVSAKESHAGSPKVERSMVPGICGSMSYEQLKKSIPDICVSFHTDECQVIYINEKDEITKL